ncbi:MAG: orotidine-5'-phosphate decarboxylase [Thermoplasmata archaeon]
MAIFTSKIIVALDIKDKDQAIDLTKKLAGDIFAVKVNWPLILNAGPDIIRDLSKIAKVICDFKIADIPYTNGLITEYAENNGAWGIISHSFTGFESLSEVVKKSCNMKVFSVVAMSHPGSEMINRSVDELVAISERSGVYGFVAPGNNPEILKHIRSLTEKIIISPGIGAQGGSASTAVENGSDYVIIGRSIYESSDPVATVKDINDQLSDNIKY